MYDTLDSHSARGHKLSNQHTRYGQNCHVTQPPARYGSLNSFYRNYSLDSILEEREARFGNVSDFEISAERPVS